MKRDRVALHLKVARLLEERFPEHVARIPNCWATTSPTAGRRRMQPAASSGPAAKRRGRLHWRRQRRIIAAGIDLLRDAEPSRECSRLEMWLQILLRNALMGLVGYGADSLRPVWIRAIELAEEVGDADELTAALNGPAVSRR